MVGPQGFRVFGVWVAVQVSSPHTRPWDPARCRQRGPRADVADVTNWLDEVTATGSQLRVHRTIQEVGRRA
jgi:hypothetical protein